MMLVAVRMRVAGGDGLGRRDPTLKVLAANVLELDGSVADLKLLAEQTVELDENARAFRRRNSAMVTWHASAREFEPRLQTCRSWTLTTPSRASMPSGYQTARAAWRAFKENVQGFADDADAGPQDERGDEQREDRIDPV